MDNTDDSESVNIEFTKEEVEALLNEKSKGEKFDPQVYLKPNKPFVVRLSCNLFKRKKLCCDELVGQSGANV